MAKEYTGAELYQRLSESVSFMRSRITQLDARLQSHRRDSAEVESQLGEVYSQLAGAYLDDVNIHDGSTRDYIESSTGLDLGFVIERFSRQRQGLSDQKKQIESDRLYLMRRSVTLEEGSSEKNLRFKDSRLNEIMGIESHIGYIDDEGLIASGYLTGEHKKGLFGFRHRRLTKLAQAVAEDLGYDSFSEMEEGHVGDLSSLSQRAGRLEMRYSVPILLLHPDLTVREVYEQVQSKINEHSQIEHKLTTLQDKEHEYATQELAKHLGLVQLDRLDTSSLKGSFSHVDSARSLKKRQRQIQKSINSIEEEEADYSRKIREVTDLMTKGASMRNSTTRIPARVVDRIFSDASGAPVPVDLPSLHDLDAIIRRDFPQAVAYKDYTRTTRRVGRQSAEYQDVVRRAGGEGKWTKWRKV